MKPLLLVMVMLAGGLVGWWTGGRPSGNPRQPVCPSQTNSKYRPVISPEVRQQVLQVKEARSPAERLRQVVILATNLPLADLPRWFEGNYLEFLDRGTRELFEQVLTDRWLAAEPASGARWMVQHGKGAAGKALASWLRVDEAAAIACVKALPVARREEAGTALVLAIGKRSVPDAVALLDELRMPSVTLDDIIGGLARQNPDGVVEYARTTAEETRRKLLTATASALLAQDLPWVVEMLQREGMDMEGLSLDVFAILDRTIAQGETGRTVLRKAALLPAGWLQQLLDGRYHLLTNGCEIDWLNLKHGKRGIPTTLLRKIQLQAAASPWWDSDRREAGKGFVEHGDWLPMEARTKIAETLVLRWQDDPAAARSWAAGLQGELHTAGEKGLRRLRDEIAAAERAKQLKTPADLMQVIEAGTAAELPRDGITWNAAETADAVRLAGNLAPEQAALFFRPIEHSNDTGLPRAVLGAILVRAILAPAAPGSDRETVARSRTGAVCRFAAGWASEDPRQAAAWVATLPPGETRLWASKNVALQWDQYASAEARAWAAKLPDAERKAVLFLLDKTI